MELLGAEIVGLVAEKAGQDRAVGELEVSRRPVVLDGCFAVALPLQIPRGTVMEVVESILLPDHLLPRGLLRRDGRSQTPNGRLVWRALDAEQATLETRPLLLELHDIRIQRQSFPHLVG